MWFPSLEVAVPGRRRLPLSWCHVDFSPAMLVIYNVRGRNQSKVLVNEYPVGGCISLLLLLEQEHTQL